MKKNLNCLLFIVTYKINKNHFLMNINIEDYKENTNNIVNKNQEHILDIHYYFSCNLDSYLMGLVDH
jgi:hypothetical protein